MVCYITRELYLFYFYEVGGVCRIHLRQMLIAGESAAYHHKEFLHAFRQTQGRECVYQVLGQYLVNILKNSNMSNLICYG
jgi:hypothetical protein